MKKISVIGAGFAGLAVAYALMKRGVEVTVYDGKGIGGGASGIAAGLMHPYVGEEVRRSFLADEALEAAGELLECVERREKVSRPGVMRYVFDEEKKQRLGNQRDVERCGENAFWIKSGRTVHCEGYLEALWQRIEALGGRFERRCVESLEGLGEVVIAAGAQSMGLVGALPVSLIKGQVLLASAKGVAIPSYSLVGKGYMAIDGSCICLGSTYERYYESEAIDEEVAKSLILPNVERFFPEVRKLDIVGARAAVRVCVKGHYFPIIKKVREGVWVVTGLGSRGLLYHALLGKRAALEILG
ncbi:MAG: hypothetical protein RLZZ453_921 [Chlamydiota bacterium]|jgi:glycine/D-amino acid oxidase-like deaminating enzyme